MADTPDASVTSKANYTIIITDAADTGYSTQMPDQLLTYSMDLSPIVLTSFSAKWLCTVHF